MLKTTIASCVFGALITHGVHAQTLSWQFTGTIHSFSGSMSLPLGDHFASNTPAVVSLTFDSHATDTCADAVHGCYALDSLLATYSGQTFSFENAMLTVRNNYTSGSGFQDNLNITASTTSSIFGAPVLLRLEVNAQDQTGATLSSDALPLFASAFFSFNGAPDQKIVFEGGSSEGVLATVTSASGGPIPPPVTSPIPEPETYAMLLAGLALLGFHARRRKESLQHCEVVTRG